MTGRGSIRHNNRSFSAANVDRSRSEQNVTFCNEDLKKVYHELFDEALAAYNAKKKKTRDKIPDYYEHIRQSKQEKLFHEAIFQIGNLTDCGCGSPGGERAAAALKEFAESFQERNPHLRVFNMVLHMDEATPHLHVDFVPVATEQSRGLSTRVSMKQALKQQGFEGLGRKQTEWKAWMEREKESLTEIAQAHEFEIISLGGGRPHMELPEYRAAAQRLEAIQEQVTAAEQEIAALEKQRKALQGNVKLLKAVEKVKPDLDAIQPEKTLTGAVKGVTVEQIKEYPLIGLGEQTASFSFFSDVFGRMGLTFTPDVAASTSDQILPMVKSDLGIGFVPMDFLEKENMENLAILNMKPDIPARNICLLKRKDISLSIAASELERQIKGK